MSISLLHWKYNCGCGKKLSKTFFTRENVYIDRIENYMRKADIRNDIESDAFSYYEGMIHIDPKKATVKDTVYAYNTERVGVIDIDMTRKRLTLPKLLRGNVNAFKDKERLGYLKRRAATTFQERFNNKVGTAIRIESHITKVPVQTIRKIIANLHKQNMTSLSQLAADVGVSLVNVNTIYLWAVDFGLAEKIDNKNINFVQRRWNKDDENLLIDLWNKDISIMEIAKTLRRPVSGIYAKIMRLKKEGVYFKPRRIK